MSHPREVAEPAGASDLHLEDAVRAARSGDSTAFRVLYRDLQPRLLRYLRALVGEDAEDVASETWLQIARDIAGFSGDHDGFRGWATTIARHRAMDHLRRTSRRPPAAPVPAEALAGLAARDDTAELALEAMSTDAAIRLIASLPADQAEAVLLRAVVGLDADSAGRILGKRAGAVRTAAHRGLRRLAAALTEDAAHPPSPPIQRHRVTYRDEPTTERHHWTEATDA